MLSKILLLSVTFPVGTWAAWANMHQSHLIIQMVFGIFISLGIFYAILCTSEYDTIFPPRMGRRLRAATPVLVPAPARGRSLNGAGVRK